MNRVLVYGAAVAGEAVARALHQQSVPFLIADDQPTDHTRALAASLGVELVEAPDIEAIDRLLAVCDLVVPAPGVPETHPLFAQAGRHGVSVCSEIELAYRWEQRRPGGPRRMLAVTGTDGKTTTTELTAAMLRTAGHRSLAVGNTDLPLIAALDDDVDVFVVECSSFRLAFTEQFRAEGSAWLNLAPDHQNWHRDLPSYIAAKARLWQALRPDDVVVGSVDDEVVRRHLDSVPARRVTVGLERGDYRMVEGVLTSPHGPIAAVTDLARALPHDVTNGLTAAALVLETGLADLQHVAATLATFTPPRHRIELVAQHAGVSWYDDSKATTPHAALTAVAAFPSLVWIVGGRNKGLDLTELAAGATHVRAVVALGEAADEVASVFDGVRPVRRAATMDEAVAAAGELARPGDAVVLSPACASYDAYRNYGERGDHFARCVRAHVGGTR